jgi:hypothetical protein
LGNEAGLPSLDDIERIRRRFGDPASPAHARSLDPLTPAIEVLPLARKA